MVIMVIVYAYISENDYILPRKEKVRMATTLMAAQLEAFKEAAQ
jgi:hypothetical protein